MTILAVGESLPEFELLNESGMPISSKSMQTGTVVLYFYPKDDTPGCTRQACDFRDAQPQYDTASISVYGVSADTVDSHLQFKEKYNLSFPLLADPTHAVCELFGVWGEQEFRGYRYVGIARTTFVIDDGIIQKVYPNVSVQDHVETVLASLGTV